MLKKTSGTTYKKIIKSLVKFEVERIEKLLEQVERQNKRDQLYLEKEFEGLSRNQFESDYDYKSYMDTFSDDVYLLNDVKILSEQLAIISLHKLVEIRTVYEVSFHITSEEIKKQLHRIDIMKSELRKLGVQLNSIKYFKEMDELRLINNCIKHSGVANKGLLKYGWQVGDKFENLTKKIDGFKKIVPEFIYDFVERLETVPLRPSHIKSRTK